MKRSNPNPLPADKKASLSKNSKEFIPSSKKILTNSKNTKAITISIDSTPEIIKPQKLFINGLPNKQNLDSKKVSNIPDIFKMPGVPTIKNLPIYMNEQICYPKEEKRPYIINFRQMLYEDLLTDLNEKKTIKTAFMTTFGFESKLQAPFATHLEKFLLINEANSPSTKIERDYNGVKNWTLILYGKPNISFGSGAYHPKLWLFKFPTFLRIVIGSGNLTIGDWTAWSNCLWFKDLPQLPIDFNESDNKNENVDFKNYQKFFLENIIPEVNKSKGLDRLKKDCDIDQNDYCFEDIFYELLGSCPGTYDMTQTENTFGFNRQSNIMKNNPPLFPFDIKKKRITYQTSALGTVDQTLTKFFINSLYPEESKQLGKDDYKSIINIIFPTMKYVEGTPFDKNFACCLFLNTETYEKPWFIKESLCKFEANDEYIYNDGVIPHLKIMVVTNDDYIINDDTVIYFGSHNCTRSAWGKLEKGNKQITLSNTELGVLYPPKKNSAEIKEVIIKSQSFKFPPKKMAKGERPFLNDVFFGKRNMF